jgi:dihydroorotase
MNISHDGSTIAMRAPDNWHAHFRQDALLAFLVGIFLRYGWRRRIVAEPNTTPAKLTGELAITYAEEIRGLARAHKHGERLEPVAVMQITELTTPEMVREARRWGVQICKVYPYMVTTHSSNGVMDYTKIHPALAAAEEVGMIVQFHGEHPSDDIEGCEKERGFIHQVLGEVVSKFPKLRITLEHICSRYGVEWVEDQGENVGAGITVQHLLNTIDDLTGYSKRSGGLICVHEGFKPQAGRRHDRAAIQRVVLEGHPRFFYAGDDAWHPKGKKHCAKASCGAANTLATLPLLASFFEAHDRLPILEPFTSKSGAEFYGYPLNEGEITLIREPWVVPQEFEVPGLGDTVIPWRAGETLEWRVVA